LSKRLSHVKNIGYVEPTNATVNCIW